MKIKAFVLFIFLTSRVLGQSPPPGNLSPSPTPPPPNNLSPTVSPATLRPAALGQVEGLSQRDPFRLPQYLILKIKEKAIVTKVELAGIDDNAEPIRRWALGAYQLVGIIWDVKKPKAMFLDKSNTIHMLHIKDHIGNGGGFINSISNGEVVVIENKTPLRLKLKK